MVNHLFQRKEDELNILQVTVRKTLDSLQDTLVVQLGGRVLQCTSGSELVFLAVVILQGGEVDPFAGAGLIEAGEALVDVLLVLVQLVFHVLLLVSEAGLHLGRVMEFPPPPQPVLPLVQDVPRQVGDDALAAVLAARVTCHLVPD